SATRPDRRYTLSVQPSVRRVEVRRWHRLSSKRYRVRSPPSQRYRPDRQSAKLPLKMQSPPEKQPERQWNAETGLLVRRKVHQPSGSANLSKNQSREPRRVRRLDPSRSVTQSSSPP